ncbi:MAG: prephenate dehydrogenase [Actinomycetota bacterium]|jgi:prephenate dehydrogenase|nr:prephenate dehydrogenase [Actinomycetota bacterium]
MRVRIVGTGLIGTSLGMALSRKGFRVSLDDPSPTAMALARDLGAGVLASDTVEAPEVVVVAGPPDVVADVVAAELAHWPDAVVTDAASVKGAVLTALQDKGVDLSRYVGSHPMAGRERSGAVAAQVDLFEGRAWVVAPGPHASAGAVTMIRQIAEAAGSAVLIMAPDEHDAAVAAVSHVPQIAASLVASLLRDLPTGAVALSGQGIRDVTRIAASDPGMWTQILSGNAPAVRAVLESFARELEAVLVALRRLESEPNGGAVGARAVLANVVAAGNAGQARIPGKHGAAPTMYATVVVIIPDEPGALGRMLRDVGEAGVNMEDLHLEHGVGQPFGLAELSVLPAAVQPLITALRALGWPVHE